MPNNYFRFKQFTVVQEKSAMKVCTDSCLFGAWSAQQISVLPTVRRVLDIGAGTGLLSLMIVQKSIAEVDAVEYNEEAAFECHFNVSKSPWFKQIHCFQSDIRKFAPTETYDWIVVNPPFFSGSLLGDKEARNLALHENELSIGVIAQLGNKWLSPTGSLSILLPYNRQSEAKMHLQKEGLFTSFICNVRQTETHDFFRVMMVAQRQFSPELVTDITIKENGSYSLPFSSLLQDYYLNL